MMLNTIYLLSIIFGVAGQIITKKAYSQKVGDKGVYFLNTVICGAAMLFFILTAGEFRFDLAVLPYSIGFGVAYVVTSVSIVLAIACGSLSLVSLFSSYSLLLPTFYGLIFLKDPVGKGFVPGLVLMMVSLFLMNRQEEKAAFSLKWILFVLLTFVGNGMCSVTQKMQQIAFDGAYKNEFMIIALFLSTVSMLAVTLLKERKELKLVAKAGWLPGVICGLLNGAVNLFVMILSGRMPVSLMFPLISVGGIIVTYLVSRFVYKEEMTKSQFAGFLLGTASVVFLNL